MLVGLRPVALDKFGALFRAIEGSAGSSQQLDAGARHRCSAAGGSSG